MENNITLQQKNLYEFNKISAKSVFIYLIILCVCVLYFRSLNITLGSFVGLIFAFLFIFLLYRNELNTQENEEDLHQLKAKWILPEPKNIQNYADMTDFIFSIQEFYEYNQQAYENLVDAIDTFLEIYENVLIDNSLAGDSYSLANNQKLLALNELHSIIMTLPSSLLLTNKFNESLHALELLLNKYLYTIYEKNKEYINKNGYFNNSKVIELNIAPYNTYSKDVHEQYY